MDLYEAVELLGLQTLLDAGNLNEKDVEKSFRKKALLYHPDKGGDAAHFQLLHRAKDRLLEHIGGNALGSSHGHHDHQTNSRSLYQHRSCVRQVLAVNNLVVAATDDGLVVIESNRNGGSKRVVYFAERSVLCCCCVDNRLYAGSTDGHVHGMEVVTREWSSWKLPRMQGVVAISAIRNFVAVATAKGSIYILDYQDHDVGATPTIIWEFSLGRKSGSRKNSTLGVSDETILLEEGSSPNVLNLWVGGGNNDSSDSITGRLLMWKMGTDSNFRERYETEDLFDEYDMTDSETEDSGSEGENDSDDDDDHDRPVINMMVPEGSIFSLSKHNNSIAVSSGQFIRIWNYQVDTKGPHGGQEKLVETQTIQTKNKTLYALCLNERFLAAAGSNECITLWDRNAWAQIAHEFSVPKSPDGCCSLATNCVMTLAWFRDDASGLLQSLVSGGYDGVVTMWTLDADYSRINQFSSS